MKSQKLVVGRTSIIEMDTESRTLSLDIVNRYKDGTDDNFRQEFNLMVMPYDMAMSVICSLINPQKSDRR